MRFARFIVYHDARCPGPQLLRQFLDAQCRLALDRAAIVAGVQELVPVVLGEPLGEDLERAFQLEALPLHEARVYPLVDPLGLLLEQGQGVVRDGVGALDARLVEVGLQLRVGLQPTVERAPVYVHVPGDGAEILAAADALDDARRELWRVLALEQCDGLAGHGALHSAARGEAQDIAHEAWRSGLSELRLFALRSQPMAFSYSLSARRTQPRRLPSDTDNPPDWPSAGP